MDEFTSSKQVNSMLQLPERVFQREEDELRRWLDANVTDPDVRKWYLEQLRKEQGARGRSL